MTHLTDDDLVLHYYGEDGARVVAVEGHLRSCPPCARAYGALARTLNAVTPPEAVEAASDEMALRRWLRERTAATVRPQPGLAALVWLSAAVYPFSFQALFRSAQWAQEDRAGLILVVLSMAWSCAGPFAAVAALQRGAADRFDHRATRLLAGGALLAAIAPALYLLVALINTALPRNAGIGLWFVALALGGLASLCPWPRAPQSTAGYVRAHRLSALLLAAFVLAHIVNQAIAFVSIPAYAAMRSGLRVVSQQPVAYAVVATAVLIQIATGAAAGMKKVRAGAFGVNLQAVSGWYLAAFLLTHVFMGLIAGFLHSAPPAAAVAAPSAASFNLLANVRAAAQLPYLVLGVAAFLVHVGVYARLAAMAYLAEAAVRRLSYAAAVAGATVVVTVALALCGVHLLAAQAPPPAAMPYTAVFAPEFVPAKNASFLHDDDILLGVVSGAVAKAYPAADLAQHGAVADVVPAGPISVTWCGVCNTGLVFRAVVTGRTLHFQYDRMVGANEVQKDAETGSSWQQATGESIDGPLKGTRLVLHPTVRTTWGAWRARYPDTLVLKPLPGYAERMPVLSKRIKDATRVPPEGAPKGALALDARLPPRETVAGLEIGREAVAFPFSQLRVARVVNERVGGEPVLIVHQPSSDTTTAFRARVNGRALTFRAADADAGALTDTETRSTWNAYGLSLDGPLKGTQLEQVALVPQFWFAWSQFRPGTNVFTAEQRSRR